MEARLVSSIAALLCAAGSAGATPPSERLADRAGGLIQLAGNTSSNSSSSTSSNSSNGRSTIVHTHRWSVDSDDGRRRRVIRGTTHIERYRPTVRYRSPRRGRDDD
jgi:hypothetical protein